jgi:hypothetical protein
MIKTRWKPYMTVLWKNERAESAVECMLVAINFDDEIAILQPLSDLYFDQDFHANIKHIELPKPKPKLAFVQKQP